MKKKIKTLTLQIPEPCGENFNKMIPVPGGRHCASCEKTIVDFRNYSDTEIARYYKRHQGKICGVFQKSQLNRAMILPKDPSKLGKWKAVAAMLSGLAIGGTASAQQTISKPMLVVQTTENTDIENIEVKQENKLLQGRVTDEQGYPLIGATVAIMGTSHGTITDTDGLFKLAVTPKFTAFELVISYLGYKNFIQKVTFEKANTSTHFITLKQDTQTLGTIVVVDEKPELQMRIMGIMHVVSKEEFVEETPIEEVKPKVSKKKRKKNKSLIATPNPFSDYLKIDFKAPVADTYIFTLYNQKGQLVFAETQELNKGKQSVEIRPNKFDLPAGTYILNVTNERDFSESTQVVKVK